MSIPFVMAFVYKWVPTSRSTSNEFTAPFPKHASARSYGHCQIWQQRGGEFLVFWTLSAGCSRLVFNLTRQYADE